MLAAVSLSKYCITSQETLNLSTNIIFVFRPELIFNHVLYLQNITFYHCCYQIALPDLFRLIKIIID